MTEFVRLLLVVRAVFDLFFNSGFSGGATTTETMVTQFAPSPDECILAESSS